MEGARSHTFRIIAFSSLFLFFGFVVGFYGARSLIIKARLPRGANLDFWAGTNAIMKKRMQAINAARKTGGDVYEFEVSGFYPVLGSQKLRRQGEK